MATLMKALARSDGSLSREKTISVIQSIGSLIVGVCVTVFGLAEAEGMALVNQAGELTGTAWGLIGSVVGFFDGVQRWLARDRDDGTLVSRHLIVDKRTPRPYLTQRDE